MAWRIYARRYIAESDAIDSNEVRFGVFCGDIGSSISDGVTGYKDGSSRDREDGTGRKVATSYKTTVFVISSRSNKA